MIRQRYEARHDGPNDSAAILQADTEAELQAGIDRMAPLIPTDAWNITDRGAPDGEAQEGPGQGPQDQQDDPQAPPAGGGAASHAAHDRGPGGASSGGDRDRQGPRRAGPPAGPERAGRGDDRAPERRRERGRGPAGRDAGRPGALTDLAAAFPGAAAELL